MKLSLPSSWLDTWFALLAVAATSLLLGTSAAAQDSAATSTNMLDAVSLARGNDDSQVVRLVFKDPVGATPIAFTTTNPNRLVLDFPATSTSLPRGATSVESGAIKTWQVVQAGQRTRLVLNLAGPSSYDLRSDRNIVLAVVRANAAPEQQTRFAPTAPTTRHGINNIDFRRGKDGESRILVTLSEPGAGIDIKTVDEAIQIDFLNTSLPSRLQQRLDVSDFSTPAQLVEAFAQGNNARMRITPKGKWDYSAWQTGNQFAVEVRPLEGPLAGAANKAQYSGEKLSLNFQNVEVRAVLQVIADFTGLNIISNDTVSGNISLRLKDVPWDQALDIILRTKGLDKRVNGNVVIIAPRDELAAKEKLELESRQQLADLEDIATEFIRLNYLRANEAQAILEGQSVAAAQAGERVSCSAQAVGVGGTAASAATTTGAGTGQRILSKRGTTSYDLKTNTLFVQDTPTKIKEMKNILSSIDVPSKQVLIEARVVVADDSFGRTLGARLGISGRDASQSGHTGIRAGFSSAYGASATSTTLTTPPGSPNVDLSASSTVGSFAIGTPAALGITIINAASTAVVGLELQALEADKRGQIISNPRVITQNQRPAVILQGQQIPYITPGTANSPATVSFKDAFLCLLVDPQVLNNDNIILNVEVQKDAAGTPVTVGTTTNIPIDTKRVKTQVRVRNGETAVLGGIFEQTTRNDTTKVPLLGDIPLIGNLFKNNVKGDLKTELLIFLTPRVLDDNLSVQ